LYQLLQQGNRKAVRGAVEGDQRREAQEAGVGDRQEAAGGRGAADHLPQPRRKLLAALCQEHHGHDQQLLQWLSLRRRLDGQVRPVPGSVTAIQRMIPKSGYRFSEKILRKKKAMSGMAEQ